MASLEPRLSEAEGQLTWIKATLQGPFTDQAEDRPTGVEPCVAGKGTKDKVDVALPTHVDLVPPSSRDSSWGIRPTVAALHGCFATLVFFHAGPEQTRCLDEG